MKHKTVWTNYFGKSAADQVEELLDQGYAVRVGVDCIGHTRAQMVECDAKAYFKNRGCKEIKIADNYGFTDTYYVL